MSNFEKWWERDGQEFLYALNTTTDDDIKLVAEIAWKNGAYCAEQAEHEIIPSWEEYCECEGIPCEPVKPVDLTDDEIYEVLKRYTKTERYKDDFGSYRAVIAADREKNK